MKGRTDGGSPGFLDGSSERGGISPSPSPSPSPSLSLSLFFHPSCSFGWFWTQLISGRVWMSGWMNEPGPERRERWPLFLHRLGNRFEATGFARNLSNSNLPCLRPTWQVCLVDGFWRVSNSIERESCRIFDVPHWRRQLTEEIGRFRLGINQFDCNASGRFVWNWFFKYHFSQAGSGGRLFATHSADVNSTAIHEQLRIILMIDNENRSQGPLGNIPLGEKV